MGESRKSDKRRVLVVDAEERVTELVKTILEGEGYDVQAASDAGQALWLVQHWKPDLVLLDIALPGMDGVEIANDWHRNPSTARVPIIALSGDRRIEAKAVQMGAWSAIRKPFNVDTLLRAVERFFDRRDHPAGEAPTS